MEIIKDITPLLDTDMFLGYENEDTMSFGIVGVIPKHKVFKKIYEFYQNEIWNRRTKVYSRTGGRGVLSNKREN